ncbi:MAG: c-type cytochrome, partial [Nitrospinota bacterium]
MFSPSRSVDLMERPLLHRARMAVWGALLGLFLVLSGCGSGETRRDGAQIYAKRCYSCHGEVGVGDGPTAALMGITPANLQIAVREKSKAELLGTIARGRRAMPAFGQSLTAGEREA